VTGSAPAEPVVPRSSVDVDTIAPDDWDRLVADFSDASYEQTACWTDGRWGARRSSHILLRRDGIPVGGSRVVVLRLPGLRRGLAYVKFGPLWRRRGAPAGDDAYRATVAALVEEYCVRRGHYLTVMPRPTPEHWEHETRMLAELGFAARRRMVDPNRYLVATTIDVATQLQSLEQKWRYNLRHALRQGLGCAAVGVEEGLGAFAAMHARMVARKRFADRDALELLVDLTRRLAEPMRPRFVLARHEGRPVAGAVVALCGDTAYYLFGASDDSALPLKAGYALHWWITGWVSELGVRWYDLGGDARSAGLRQFKKGLVGKSGTMITQWRELDRWTHVRARLAGDCIFGLRGAQRTLRSLPLPIFC
jgi:CelD/BcsL family acetyltransferase involved in cellulose biosynthesis